MLMHLDLLLISAARALVEVAGFALLGQGLLALLTREQRHANVFYKILAIITTPVVKTVRRLTPRRILDAHIPTLAFFLLLWLWLALALAKRYLCGLHGLAC